jgi:hypothetical protein
LRLKTKLLPLCWLIVSVLTWRADGAAVLPWPDGERLTYEVYWGAILAAEGKTTAISAS